MRERTYQIGWIDAGVVGAKPKLDKKSPGEALPGHGFFIQS
jgi:hypothetical protein